MAEDQDYCLTMSICGIIRSVEGHLILDTQGHPVPIQFVQAAANTVAGISGEPFDLEGQRLKIQLYFYDQNLTNTPHVPIDPDGS